MRIRVLRVIIPSIAISGLVMGGGSEMPSSAPPDRAIENKSESVRGTAQSLNTFALVSTAALSPSSDPVLSLSSSELERRLWVANAIYHVNATHDWSLPILASVTTQAIKDNPGIDYSTLQSTLNQIRATYAAQRAQATAGSSTVLTSTPAQTLSALLDIFGTLPGVPMANALATAGRSLLKLSDNAYQALVAPLEQQRSQLAQYQAFDFAYQYGSDAFGGLLEQAQNNPPVAALINGVFASDLNAQVGATKEQLLDPSLNPGFATAV